MENLFQKYKWTIDIDATNECENRLIIKSNNTVMSMERDDARSLCETLCEFFGMSMCLNEATDNELRCELERRGYSGKLSITNEFELKAKR